MRTTSTHFTTAIELKSGKNFFTERLLLPLEDSPNVYPSAPIDNCINYSTSDFYDNFSKSELLLYFRGLNVDVPRSLTPIASYRRTSSKTKLTRFNNYFQREGKKLKFMLLLLKAYDQVSATISPRLVSANSTASHWREVFNLTNFSSWESGSLFKNSLPYSTESSFAATWQRQRLLPYEVPTLDKFLFKNLLKLDFLFSFYIHKIDKHLFKNSRGKSGKFTFIWKYVPSYKRFNLISHWFMRELRVTPGQSLFTRLVNLLHIFLTSFHKSWLWKVKKFSSVFVYSNLRNSLAQTYKISRKSR